MSQTTAPAPRKAYRDTREPVLGGVCAGLATHLAVPVLWVRAGFLVAAVLGGMGVAMYAGLWLVLPADSRFEEEPPGLASATRGGRRPRRARRLQDLGPAVALAALGLGALLLLEGVLGRGAVFWPIAIGLAGVALLWRQADEAQRERWLDTTGRVDPVRVVLGSGGWASYLRIAAGASLLVGAVFIVGFDNGGTGGSTDRARGVLIAAALGVAALAVVVGPWVYRLAGDLSAEREERVRSQERADVAAHLHDSVLQTLALIQKSADDGATVARLARAQERDLRAWLFAGETTGADTLAGALREVAAEVEDAHGVEIDLVAVGDCPLLEPLRPVVAATREALTNAAKHAGTGRVDVYAEVGPDVVEVFVRDRGTGFDLDAVPADRQGVRGSILDRMTRHGGRAEIRTAPGGGTEVRLHLPRPAAPQEETP
jgi:signal transduction histidine kinase/phage shock protein PspC (stress-responsive transcriptional regulator)